MVSFGGVEKWKINVSTVEVTIFKSLSATPPASPTPGIPLPGLLLKKKKRKENFDNMTDEGKTTSTTTTTRRIPENIACLLCEEYDNGKKNNKISYTCRVVSDYPRSTLASSTLPDQVLVSVDHTALTYADALVILGRSGGAREYPIIPGTDFAGVVVAEHAEFHVGDRVVAHGGQLGRAVDGGFSTLCYCSSSTVTLLPEGISTLRAAQMGSAAVTAMCAVIEIENFQYKFQHKGRKEILISGATGAVGGFALSLLSGLGYTCTALTRSTESYASYLTQLGATKVLSCDEVRRRNSRNSNLIMFWLDTCALRACTTINIYSLSITVNLTYIIFLLTHVFSFSSSSLFFLSSFSLFSLFFFSFFSLFLNKTHYLVFTIMFRGDIIRGRKICWYYRCIRRRIFVKDVATFEKRWCVCYMWLSSR